MIIFKRVKVENYNITLRNFLSWLMLNKEKLKEELNNSYSNKEKNNFIYNCSIITLNDFFSFERYYNSPKNTTNVIINLFKENFKLREFQETEIIPDIPKKAISVIDKFLYLKSDLSNKEKNELMKDIRFLLTSV